MNFSVLDLFKFASRMPQIEETLVSTFKIIRGSMPLDPPRNFLFIFLSQFQVLYFVWGSFRYRDMIGRGGGGGRSGMLGLFVACVTHFGVIVSVFVARKEEMVMGNIVQA